MSQPPLVLVVDDEACMRDLVVDVLQAEGYAVGAADNGQHALEYLQRGRPDAIVLDLMMPVLDGWAFMEAYREVAGAEIPVIGVSAAMSPRVAERLGQLGVQACLAKPFEITDLLAYVARAVRTPETTGQRAALAEPNR